MIILIKYRIFSDSQQFPCIVLPCRQSWHQTATRLPFAAVNCLPCRILHKSNGTARAHLAELRSPGVLRSILAAYFCVRGHYRYFLTVCSLATLELQSPALSSSHCSYCKCSVSLDFLFVVCFPTVALLNAVFLGTMHATVILIQKMPWT